VVHAPEDISFAAEMESQCKDNTQRLLQPGWESSIGEELSVEHVRQHAQWRLSLQSHKWLGIR
jgi:organic radical activating enzyme